MTRLCLILAGGAPDSRDFVHRTEHSNITMEHNNVAMRHRHVTMGLNNVTMVHNNVIMRQMDAKVTIEQKTVKSDEAT